MEKYLGNKKHIVNEIKNYIDNSEISSDFFIDLFSGTTNVGQYFKQKGYSIISNDINYFSYVYGMAYIKNNKFPKFKKLFKYVITDFDYYSNIEEEEDLKWIRKRIQNDKVFSEDYYERVNFDNNIIALEKVLQFLNNLSIDNLNNEESIFYDYYTKEGKNSQFISLRKSEGKRNYFSAFNAKKIGKILYTIKNWYTDRYITKNELFILITCLLEEVALIANVNGTFHDFNRKKLYPNALVNIHLKPIAINVFNGNAKYYVFCDDANEIVRKSKYKRICPDKSILYIDPPYNFRQYSAYYHMLNFIAKYYIIENIEEYASHFEFVRGQNMQDNFDSKYCYKDTFTMALHDLINDSFSRYILISYYDENNHWNHGKKVKTFKGREEVCKVLNDSNIDGFINEPYIVRRQNYQSQNGEHKKDVDELLYYAWRNINVDNE